MNFYRLFVVEGVRVQGNGDNLWRQMVTTSYTWIDGIAAVLSMMVYTVSDIFVPIWLKVLRNALRSSARQVQLVKENADLQLERLRTQINPHFFFNTLNNLQSFIIHDEKHRAVQLLNQMADLMRLSLYEMENKLIPLHKETRLIKNYVGIEAVRFEADAVINVELDSFDGAIAVPPLLLLSIVENAFTHSSGLEGLSVYVNVRLRVQNKQVHFIVDNHYHTSSRTNGGIGLINLKKRLHLYFGETFTLNISKNNSIHSVDLKFPANELSDCR